MRPLKLLTVVAWVMVFCFPGSFPLASRGLEGHNLIIITLDTTRADYIGFYNPEHRQLTPNIDRVAGDGVGFRHCYSPVPLTLPAHCSVFTGKYPPAHGVRNNASYSLPREERTLAEIFKTAGYHTHAVVSAYVVAAKFGLEQGFSLYDDGLDSSNLINSFSSEIDARAVYRKFKQWFDTHHAERFFSWVHFFDPHQPYEPPAPYDRKYPDDPYAGEVAHVDEYVGKIIRDLKEKNLYEKTLVVIFGDHGEDLGEHGEYGHGTFCYNPSLEVPLIFSKNLGFETGALVETPVSLVDVMPTLLELFGLDPDRTLHGISLLPLASGGGDKNGRLFYFESLYPNEEMGWAPVTGVIRDGFKLIHLPKSELYDLENDPGEKTNLFYKKYNISQPLKKQLDQFVKEHSEEKSAFRKKLSSRDLRHLTSLGYVSSFKKSKNLIDPKRGMAFKGRLREVKALIVGGQPDRAEAALKKAVADEPEIRTPIIWDLFVEIYARKKDRDRLIAVQREAIQEFPHNNQLKIKLANTYFNFSRFQEAAGLCREIIDIDPGYSRAFILLGKIDLNRNRFNGALENFKRALELEPRNTALKKMYSEVLIRSGDIAGAVDILKAIGSNHRLLENPDDHPILIDVASRLISLNEGAAAGLILNRIRSRDPDNAAVLSELAGLEIKQGNLGKAAGLYEQAVKIDPDSAAIHCDRGILDLIRFQKTRDRQYLDRALEKFNSALERDPRHAPAVNGRASVYMFSNRVWEAIRDWETTIEIQPDFIDAYFNLGIVFIRLRQGERALKYLNILDTRYLNRLSRDRRNQLGRLIREAKNLTP